MKLIAPTWRSTTRQVRLSMPGTSAEQNPEPRLLSSCRCHPLIRPVSGDLRITNNHPAPSHHFQNAVCGQLSCCRQSTHNRMHCMFPRTTAGIVTAAVARNNTFIKPTARNESKANYLVPLDKREMHLEKNSNRCKRSPNPGSPLGRCRGPASAHFCNRFS